MKQFRIYIDTSVVGGCFDVEFAEASRALLRMAAAREVELVLSELLLQELERAPQHVQRELVGILRISNEVVPITDGCTELRDAYLRQQIVGPSCSDDALHVALAPSTARILWPVGTSNTWCICRKSRGSMLLICCWAMMPLRSGHPRNSSDVNYKKRL